MTDISLNRGELKTFTFQALRNDIAFDISDASIYFALRTKYPESTIVNDTDAVLTKTVGTGIQLTDPTNGYFTISFVKNDTYSLIARKYYYGIEIILNGETDPRVLGKGQFTLESDIVRQV